ncbi:MAG: ABC transporter permease [Candidatus Didemnitutus sp.]|nr:ABC transporter permease [Candidatus Didemnitutus sp.]
MMTLRLALRSLLKNPGFTATVALVLALGIGATTAIFSVIHAVLLHPFPYKQGNEILFVAEMRTTEPNSQFSVTYPDFLDWQKAVQTTEELVYAGADAVTLTGIPEPASLRNATISAGAWSLLGMQPLLGRVFTAEEDRPSASPVVVLSHATWKNRFASDPAILSRVIQLNGVAYTVIGVMPANFKFWAGDVWTPVGLNAGTPILQSRVLRTDSWVVTRPKPGKTMEDVRAELNLIAAQIAKQHPDTNKDVGVRLERLAANTGSQLRDPLLILLAAVGGVLLIACANVANLLLARTTARRREFAVRAALGADRGQLLRQTLVECVPLAALGGIGGIVLAYWGLEAILAVIPADAVPAESEIRVNGLVLLFSLGITLGTLLLFALFPALEGSRAALAPGLADDARGTASARTGRVRSGLIVAEVALSLMLLVAAGLLLRNFAQLQRVDLGFDREHLLVIPIQLPESRYATTEQSTQFFEAAIERLRRLPVVASVAHATNVPMMGGSGMPLVVEGKTYNTLDDLQGVQFTFGTADLLRAQGIRIKRGRGLEPTDTAGSQPVIVLNEAAVKHFLPDGDPLGQRVMLGIPAHLNKGGILPPELAKTQWATVVGVVENVRHFGPVSNDISSVYAPLRQAWDFPPLRRAGFLLVRTKGAPLDAVPMVRSTLRQLDPNLPVERITTMDLTLRDFLRGTRFNTLLLGLFAGTALALAAVGIYGVVAWSVTQRTREIGVRLALGAERSAILRLVIFQSMRVVALGLALGLVGALATTRFLQSQLAHLSAFDPWTFAAVVVVLACSALLACWLPARRATQVNPVDALRAE